MHFHTIHKMWEPLFMELRQRGVANRPDAWRELLIRLDAMAADFLTGHSSTAAQSAEKLSEPQGVTSFSGATSSDSAPPSTASAGLCGASATKTGKEEPVPEVELINAIKMDFNRVWHRSAAGSLEGTRTQEANVRQLEVANSSLWHHIMLMHGKHNWQPAGLKTLLDSEPLTKEQTEVFHSHVDSALASADFARIQCTHGENKEAVTKPRMKWFTRGAWVEFALLAERHADSAWVQVPWNLRTMWREQRLTLLRGTWDSSNDSGPSRDNEHGARETLLHTEAWQETQTFNQRYECHIQQPGHERNLPRDRGWQIHDDDGT